MMKEIGNKSREFYEFVLPPVDMHLDEDKLTLLIDIPGFEKKDIKISLDGNILSIQACKQPSEEENHNMIVSNFSTTTEITIITSEIGLMDTVHNYFEFDFFSYDMV